MIQHKKLGVSFKYAFEGIWYALRENQNLRIAFVGAVLVIIASIFFKVNNYEKGILGITILLVVCAEMINSAIEQMVDLITTEHRQEAKIAKDVSAGMVVLTLIGSIIVGLLIFTPYIINYFF